MEKKLRVKDSQKRRYGINHPLAGTEVVWQLEDAGYTHDDEGRIVSVIYFREYDSTIAKVTKKMVWFTEYANYLYPRWICMSKRDLLERLKPGDPRNSLAFEILTDELKDRGQA